MQKTLVSTKLFRPTPRQAFVPRPALTVTLDRARNHALTLVSAPPGYGKTTQVSIWIEGTNFPYTWLSLDEGDNDPILFLEYFLTALHGVVPSVRPDALDLLQGTQALSFEGLMVRLINETASAADFFLVLDDFHVLKARPLLDMFAFLIDHLPPSWHMVLLSRTDPALPLSRLRARRQLLEIRVDQLRFTAEEISHFFCCVMGMELTGPDVEAIEKRTEGWIAGLQLAGLAMQSAAQEGKDPHSFLSTFTGSHGYIMDFLIDEVLLHQPDHVRSFLMQTASLERMCGPLCEAVVQKDPTIHIDCQTMLEALEQDHLFIIPLDTERGWYRYHHLFKEVLSRRLEAQFPERIPQLHHHASVWYEQHDFIHEAVHHAQKAGDSARIARLVEQHGCDLIMKGEVVTLADWLAAIEPYTRARPWLAMQKAWMLLLTGQLERALPAIDAGEKLLSGVEPDSDRSTLQGSFAAARAHWANLQGKADLAAECAQRALDFLGVDNNFSCSLRSVATSLLGDSSWRQGKLAAALKAYLDAARIGQAANSPHMEIISITNLADILFEQGHFHQAARKYSEALQLAELVDGPNSAYAAKLHFGSGKVFYAWNLLDKASVAIEQASRLARHWGISDLQAACLVLTAGVECASGNLEKAKEAMAAVAELVDERPLSPTWTKWVEAALAHFWLDQGKIDQALLLIHRSGLLPKPLSAEALSRTGIELEDPIRYDLEPVYLVFLRLFLVLGNSEAALTICERLLPEARAGERGNTVTELLILQALAFQLKKDIPSALAALEDALTLARPEQSRRLFLDEGEPMAKLLYQAKARRVGGGTVDELLSCMDQLFGMEPAASQPIQNLLVEPLSARELEVLKCLAEGFSNQEIAERLVISPKTVKRHISNIYGKLEAKSRTQAVSLARALKLLD